MAIIREVPKLTKIIDRRKPDGGFYVAECDVCGRTYYPARITSKYCSSQCAMKAYRKRKENGKTANKSKTSNLVFSGNRKEVLDYIREKFGIFKKDSKKIVDMENDSWMQDYDEEVCINTDKFNIYKKNQRYYEVHLY